MTLWDAIILGLVEGATEFIPVSSTGHLILAKALLGLDSSVDSYLVSIQLGATIAVALYYRKRIAGMVRGVTGGDSGGRRLLLNLFVAFLPAAVLGLLVHNLIENLFFNPLTVAVALMVGAVIMIGVERAMKGRESRIDDLDRIGVREALLVGLSQCFALWPGMSRSMSTIVGGRLCGLSNSAAADFSFLLALPTLGAATVYSLVKDRATLSGEMLGPACVGLLVSFVSGWLAMAWFLRVLKRLGLEPFGWYRLAVGLVVLGLWFAGHLRM